MSNGVATKLFEAWYTLIDPYVLSARVFVVLDSNGEEAALRRDELMDFLSNRAVAINAAVSGSVSTP